MDGQDGMDVNESRIAQLEAELASKDATIAILLGNISDMEEELEAVDNVIEMYYMMFVQIQNDINWHNQTRDLSYAELYQADLFAADLRYVDLSNAYMDSANLGYAELSNANLNYANLGNANLNYANLGNANLISANLGNAYLISADLTGADLTGADLTGVNWGNTICPDGINSDDNGYTCENNL